MATTDQEMTVTIFACPYLKCDACGRRAVGIIGPMNTVVNLLNGTVTISLPANSRNWPCYDQATRTIVCDNWASNTGCTHTQDVRAQHSNSFTFEGTRK